MSATTPSALSPALEISPDSDSERRARRLRRLAAFLAVLAVGLALAIFVLGSKGDRRFFFDIGVIPLAFVANVVLFPVMGALIVQRRPTTRVAWLMIALGIGIGLGLVTYAYGVVGQPPAPPLPLAMASLVISQIFFVPSIGAAATWILLLYPTDHLIGSRWRVVGWVAVIFSLVYGAVSLVKPGELDPVALPGLLNPIGLGAESADAVNLALSVMNAFGLAALVAASLSLVVRYRRAEPLVAAQIRWLALVAGAGVVSFGVSVLPLGEVTDLPFGLGLALFACMPIAIGIAITRYRLYDIDRLINRALVYGSLTAILAGVFTAAVGLGQRLFVAYTGQTSDAAIVLTTLVVATLYAPLRKRLEAIVDRWFKYESRQFGAYRAEVQKFLQLSEPDLAARRLAAEAAAELEPVGLAVVDRDGATLATAGLWPQPVAMRLPVGRGDDSIGTLLVGPRRDGQPYDAREVEELAALAILVGTAAIRR
jgi:MFS family permease